jgi:hypothetical protein
MVLMFDCIFEGIVELPIKSWDQTVGELVKGEFEKVFVKLHGKFS